jgi:hypothetical protein
MCVGATFKTEESDQNDDIVEKADILVIVDIFEKDFSVEILLLLKWTISL